MPVSARYFIFLSLGWLLGLCYYRWTSGPSGGSDSEPVVSSDKKPTIPDMFGAPSTSHLPVYFLSHGAPTFLYRDTDFGGDSGAFDVTRQIGQTILNDIKPAFIVVVSAHWQQRKSASTDVSINVPAKDSEHELIYDFSGFPAHMYKETFHANGSETIARKVQHLLTNAGITSQITTRGLDHGVWVPLKVAFPSGKLDIPLIPMSLSSHDADFLFHNKLGQALAGIRQHGGLLITSGMAVHNLHEIGSRGPFPYVDELMSVIDPILEQPSSHLRFSQFQELKFDHLLRQAHPTLEHFVPLIVASGAASSDVGVPLYEKGDGSIGWGIYKFGDIHS